MIKAWYLHVRDETMAPARMVAFMEEHTDSCEICQQDPELRKEIAKITEMVLPESKIPKAVRQQKIQEEAAVVDDEVEESTDSEEVEDVDPDEEDEEELL
ncbi:MAG: hypothetical protein N2A40_07390 [Desulfobulbaceae bacterium]